MLLHTKLAFEIWAGIVLLIVVIGGVAGFTLVTNDVAPLIRTQANNPSPSPALSETAIEDASLDISGALLGGTNP